MIRDIQLRTKGRIIENKSIDITYTFLSYSHTVQSCVPMHQHCLDTN